MGIACVNGQAAALAAGAMLVLSVSLGGCATSIAGSSPMDARAEALAPSKASGYLPVEVLPQKPEIMKADEQLKLKNELIAARDRQAVSAKAPSKPTGVQRTHRPAKPSNQAIRQ